MRLVLRSIHSASTERLVGCARHVQGAQPESGEWRRSMARIKLRAVARLALPSLITMESSMGHSAQDDSGVAVDRADVAGNRTPPLSGRRNPDATTRLVSS